MKKLQLNPPTEKKNLPNGKHQMKMFSCRIGRHSSGWKRRLEKRSVMKVMSFGKQMVDLFFFSHIVLCSNTVDIRPRSTDTNFPKRMNKHHWQIEEEVYFSLLIFLLSLSLFMLCYSNCHFTFVLICSLDLFWPRVCVYVCLSKCLVHRPVFLFIIFFLLLTHSSLT